MGLQEKPVAVAVTLSVVLAAVGIGMAVYLILTR